MSQNLNREMTQINIISVFLLALILLNSCQGSKNDPNEIIAISDELKVEMWEGLGSEGREFMFRISTVSNLDCHNFQLAYSLTRPNGNVILSINNIIEPENCESGVGPARSQAVVGPFEVGIHDIEINLQNSDIINKGRLFTYNDRYEIDMETDHGIVLSNEPLFRVPQETYWGYLGYEDATVASTINDEFYNALETIATQEDYHEGDYGYFKINDDQTLEINADKGFELQSNFIFKLNASETTLREIIQDIRSNYGSDVELRVYSSVGTTL